jgi:hypothetical protein
LYETLYAGHVRLFVAASEFFTYAVSQLVVLKIVSSKCSLQGARTMEVGGG